MGHTLESNTCSPYTRVPLNMTSPRSPSPNVVGLFVEAVIHLRSIKCTVVPPHIMFVGMLYICTREDMFISNHIIPMLLAMLSCCYSCP